MEMAVRFTSFVMPVTGGQPQSMILTMPGTEDHTTMVSMNTISAIVRRSVFLFAVLKTIQQENRCTYCSPD